MHQKSLFAPESMPPRAKYEKLFENLPKTPSTKKSSRGRPPVSRDALLKRLIYRNLRGIHKLLELEFELQSNPSIAGSLGLDPMKRPPSNKRFSDFFRNNPNGYFQSIRQSFIPNFLT